MAMHHLKVNGGKGQYIEITDEELEAIALESTRTIDIDQFVPKTEIDDLYNIRPYYIAPEGRVGVDAFAVTNTPNFGNPNTTFSTSNSSNFGVITSTASGPQFSSEAGNLTGQRTFWFSGKIIF